MIPQQLTMLTTALLLFRLECRCSVPECTKKSPVGVQMCMLLCRNISSCRAPVYLYNNLTCYMHQVEKLLDGAITLDVIQNRTLERRTCQPYSKIVSSRNRKVRCIECPTNQSGDGSIFVAYDTSWFRYVIKNGACTDIRKWSIQPGRMTVDSLSHLIYWFDGHSITRSPVSNLSQRTILYEDKNLRNTIFTYDETSNLLFHINCLESVTNLNVVNKTSGSENSTWIGYGRAISFAMSKRQRCLYIVGSEVEKSLIQIKKIDYSHKVKVIKQTNTSCYCLTYLTFDEKDNMLYFLCEQDQRNQRNRAINTHYIAIDSNLTTNKTLYSPRPDQQIFLQAEDHVYVIGRTESKNRIEVYDRRMRFQYNATGCDSGRDKPIKVAYYLGVE